MRYYIERHQEKIEKKSKERKRDYLNSLERLITFWSDKTIFDINEKNCAAYQQTARPGKPLADNTARRELQDLKAMVLYGIRKLQLQLNGHIIDWELPEAPQPRMTYYSHSEVAKLVRFAYRAKNNAIGEKGHKTSKHLARFILIAVHTGTRSEKIEQASFENVDGRPWIDVDSGIFYRAGVRNKSPLNKRADPVRIPDRLLHQLKRWKKEGSMNVIEHNGKTGSTRRAFYALKLKVLDEKRAKEVNRHTFKHTCASWLTQRGVTRDIIASFLSTTEEVIKDVYQHFSPDFHVEINDSQKRDREKRTTEAQKRRAQAAKAA
ncbi:phage integrase SAM-like domain-containing protein [Rhizobium ruizarguesonis]|uniref:phage integrase SAM-like domain-containing protein n=1 Tax=Rhizobium ruizarguesonis TaxID=2081791 RepID=UPI00299ED302|nr:phage integrase SAM-like domain-containing protein [Rhizobium ruizarguesonis]